MCHINSTVRWGLLSTAHINRRIIPAIRASKRGKLVAVASRDQTRAEEYAAHWDIPNAYGSYDAMLTSESIDSVYISLPNHLHAEWSIRAMQAGKHVLCEKPIAINVEQIDQMIITSQQHNRVLAEAFMYRHHPQTKIAGEWVFKGRLGEIILIWSVFNFTIIDRKDVRLVPEYGGGSLWDVGVYPLSLAQFIYGEAPLNVSGAQLVGDSGVDETFAGQLVYSGQRFAQIASSFRTPFQVYAEIIGTEGRLTMNRPYTAFEDNRHMVFQPKEGNPYEIPVPSQELYCGEIEDMNDAILEGKPSYLSLQESRNHIRTAIALYESARNRKIVYLDKNTA
jgi:xylose dehydrogenase (NAD/NADP)